MSDLQAEEIAQALEPQDETPKPRKAAKKAPAAKPLTDRDRARARVIEQLAANAAR